MANLYFHNPQTVERSAKKMHLEVSIGASGAPTLVRGINITSITRNSAGLYTIVLPKFNKFLSAHFTRLLATVESGSVQLTAVNAAAGTVQFMTIIAGAAADLSSGTVLYIDLEYKNTAVLN